MSSQKMPWFAGIVLLAGLAFLYIPLVMLVIYSFNESSLVTVWSGFSTKWYSRLLQNDEILSAAWLSFADCLCRLIRRCGTGHHGWLRIGTD